MSTASPCSSVPCLHQQDDWWPLQNPHKEWTFKECVSTVFASASAHSLVLSDDTIRAIVSLTNHKTTTPAMIALL